MDTGRAIGDFSDLELLEMLCSTTEDEGLYKLFVERFLPEVKRECVQICKKRSIDEHIGIEIAHDTFERVRKYKTFRADKVSVPNIKKAIHVYLMRIAARRFNSYHAKEKHEDVIHKTYFDEIFEADGNKLEANELKDIKDNALLIFKTLNKKEQRIVLADLEYKRSHKYLPVDVVDTLAEELGIKRDTVRKIRERALKKIKDAINEVNKS